MQDCILGGQCMKRLALPSSLYWQVGAGIPGNSTTLFSMNNGCEIASIEVFALIVSSA